jgi:alkylation response protein AidB-like acyl-CoA dehydrogenase
MVLATQLDGHLEVSTTGLVLPLRSVWFDGTGALSSGLLLAGAPDEVAVPVLEGDVVALVRGVAAAEPVEGIDPHAHVRRPRAFEVTETVALPAGAWDRAVALGLLCVAHETLGCVNALMDLAVDHVSNRHQFGVPIGTFQAVQHRLADVHVAREAARVVTDLAWESREPALCAAALGAARRAFDSARVNCHQVMGAMGFTWEHDQHWYLRRGLLLELLLDHRPGLEAAVDTIIVSQNRSEVWV